LYVVSIAYKTQFFDLFVFQHLEVYIEHFCVSTLKKITSMISTQAFIYPKKPSDTHFFFIIFWTYLIYYVCVSSCTWLCFPSWINNLWFLIFQENPFFVSSWLLSAWFLVQLFFILNFCQDQFKNYFNIFNNQWLTKSNFPIRVSTLERKCCTLLNNGLQPMKQGFYLLICFLSPPSMG